MKYSKIKAATVAIAKVDKNNPATFEIVGSGACIDPKGIILTCEHVISAFMAIPIQEQVKGYDQIAEPVEFDSPPFYVPYAIFYDVNPDGQLLAYPSRVDQMIAATDQDIGFVRVLDHPSFSNGYPSVDIDEYDLVHEGLEIGTCGFPLGNFLQRQMGTVTSSFTFGSISSISPFQGVKKENLQTFQLDITATHGNSGGPVFNKENEKIIGVLQGGILHSSGTIQPGLVRCEPLYRIVEGEELELLRELGPGEQVSPERLKKLKKKT